MDFQILLPNGKVINQTTTIKSNGKNVVITNEAQICRLIRSDWRKDTQSTSFQSWADELNNSGEYGSIKFDKYDGLDNLCSNYHVTINMQAVNLFDFFIKNLPFRN